MNLSARTLWVIPAIVLALLTPIRADQAPPPPALPALDVNVSVVPTGAGRSTELLARPAQTFDCAFSVLEPGTRDLYVKRHFTVPPGEHNSVSASQDGLQFTFSASIDAEATRVTTEVTVSSASGATSRYRSNLWLPRASGSQKKGPP